MLSCNFFAFQLLMSFSCQQCPTPPSLQLGSFIKLPESSGGPHFLNPSALLILKSMYPAYRRDQYSCFHLPKQRREVDQRRQKQESATLVGLWKRCFFVHQLICSSTYNQYFLTKSCTSVLLLHWVSLFASFFLLILPYWHGQRQPLMLIVIAAVVGFLFDELLFFASRAAFMPLASFDISSAQAKHVDTLLFLVMFLQSSKSSRVTTYSPCTSLFPLLLSIVHTHNNYTFKLL